METSLLPLYLPEAAERELEVARQTANHSDEIFLEQLVEGYKWQIYTLNALQAHGYWGRICPLSIRPSRMDAPAYADDFDILIGGYNGWIREIEVKARSQRFVTPDSFPFDSVFVEPVSRFDARDGVYPDYWAVVSTKNGALMFAPDESMDEWAVESALGREYMAAPRTAFMSLAELCTRLPPIGSHS